MSVTIQLDLPDPLITEARQFGWLEPGSLSDLLAIELRRRKAAASLAGVLERIHRQPGEAVSEADIAAEIKAARRERGGSAAGR